MFLQSNMMDRLDLENQTFNPLLVLPVVLSAAWILWDFFYVSYLLAFLVKLILNLFLKESGIHIGQLRINLLAGRVIFKDLQIYRRDDSIRIADGYGILRWWKKPHTTNNSTRCKRCSSLSTACANNKSSLIFLQLNGLEYHWYNRSDVYDLWNRPKHNDSESDRATSLGWISSIQPTVHCSVNKGRLLFGNQLLERSLVVYFDHAQCHYSMTTASNPYDELMHLVHLHGDNVRAVLEPSPGFVGQLSESFLSTEEVTATESEGYLIMKTDHVECMYSLDMPGLVPLDDTSSPRFAFDVYVGTNTVVNYGTFANRQRILLQNFFFPNDYTVRPVDRYPQPGEKRVYTTFDVSVFVSSPAKLNVFFKTTSHLSFTVSGPSNLVVCQPWITKESGYTTTITGKFTNVEVLTSLPYQPLAKAQDVTVSTKLHFPRVWNTRQVWDMKFSVTHSEVNILFSYVDFFNDLLDDWVGNENPDLLSFVPLDWCIGVDMQDYEIYLFTNRYNWLDTSPTELENGRLAFCGKTGHISFELPLTEFLPDEQKVYFSAHGHNMVVRRYYPPSSMSKQSVFKLSSCNRSRWRLMDPPEDRTLSNTQPLLRSMSQPIEPYQQPHRTRSGSGSKMTDESGFQRLHRRRGSEPLMTLAQVHCLPMEGIVEETEELESNTRQKSFLSSLISNRELFPMGHRSNTLYQSGWVDLGCGPSISIDVVYCSHNSDVKHVKTNSRMIPSILKIDVNAPSVLIRVFGSLARDLLALKENYPGEYMYFKTFSSQESVPPETVVKEQLKKYPNFDSQPDLSNGPHEPDERFLDVIVHFQMHDITGEFPIHVPDGYPKDFPLPSAHSDSFSVYVEYKGNETTVRLDVGPVTVHLPSLGCNNNYSLGHMALSGVKFTCHGFTEFLLKERVEYAWMMKLDIGKIAGCISGDQIFSVIDLFHIALSHIISYGDDFFEAPDAIAIEPSAEPLSELLKYKLFALTVASVDVHLKEANTLMKLQSPGFDLDLCNLHNNVRTLTISFCLKHLNVSSYVASPSTSSMFLECACIDVGSIQGDIRVREPHEAAPDRQQHFLRRSDASSQRLWFLWDENYQCGCCGGCEYLGGFIKRDESPYKCYNSRYFSQGTGSTLSDCDTNFPEQFPANFTFSDLLSINSIHQILLTNYSFTDVPAHCHDTVAASAANASPPKINIELEALSQDSESSFDTAPTSLHSLVLPSDDESYESLQNSPQVTDKPARSKRTTRSDYHDGSKQKAYSTTHDSDYVNALDTYKCQMKTLHIVANGRQCMSTPRKSGALLLNTTPTSSTQPSPWRHTEHREKRSPKKNAPYFVLEIPHLSHISVGHLPSVVPSIADPASFETSRRSHYFADKSELDEKTLAFLSVSVNVIRNIGVFVSPPAVKILDKYISCANKFFMSRTAHSFLESISFESLGAVKSHLAQISPLKQSIPSNQSSPLVHFSLSLNPYSYGTIQLLHSTPIPSLFSSHKSSQVTRSSFVTIHTSGIKCNALFYHHNVTLQKQIDNDFTSGSIQMTLKIAGDLQVPVLQAGLYILTESSLHSGSSFGLLPSHSLLDFAVELPASNSSLEVVNIAELTFSKVSTMITAKIIQSELSTDPILTWFHVDDHLQKKSLDDAVQKGGDSELSHNAVAININVPSVRLQIGGSSHGIPNVNDVCIDPAIIATYVRAWKPLIETVVDNIRKLWRNKVVHDRQLLLKLITCSIQPATKPMISMPLLNVVSSQLRQSPVCAFINQLWMCLSLANEEFLASSSNNFSSVYKEGYLLQEIMGTSLALIIKLCSQVAPCFVTPVSLLNTTKSCHEYAPTPSVVTYHNINPSHSDLPLTIEQGQYDEYYQLIVDECNYYQVVVLRESLLPFYKSSNIAIAPQLKQECYNKSKLSVDYWLLFQENAVLVVDSQVAVVEEGMETYDVIPELLLEQLQISGSLEYVTESRTISSQTGNYIITVRSEQSSDSPKKLRSNITSKCSVSLETLSVHISLPLLMVFRHTSESLRHMRKLFEELKISHIINTAVQTPNKNNVSEGDGDAVCCWSNIQNLVQQFRILEQKQHPQSRKSVLPETSQNAFMNTSKAKIGEHSNPDKLSSPIDELGSSPSINSQISNSNEPRNPSLSSLISYELPDSPIDTAIDVETSTYFPPNLAETNNDDTTDSPHMFSSDPDAPIQSSMATYTSRPIVKPSPLSSLVKEQPEAPNMGEILTIPDEKLESSIFGSIKITTIQVSTQIETIFVAMEIQGLSGSIDSRQIPPKLPLSYPAVPLLRGSHIPLLYKLLPTYFSVASTLKKSFVRVEDGAISTSDLAVLSSNNIEICTSMYYGPQQLAPAYRCLVKFPLVIFDVKQPPIVMHKRLHKYIPTFTTIYNEVFAPSKPSIVDEISTPVNVSDLQFPPHLPKGSALFYLQQYDMTVRPLSSLAVSYDIKPLTAQLETSSVIKFSFNIGEHNLEFHPKEYKDELSLRVIPLPLVVLKGSIVPQLYNQLPSITLELAIKQVVINVSTDVLNQILILQTAFIREINELLNMFFNIGESIPQEKFANINLKQSTESGFELISLLNSVKLSMQGIKVTVSTPLATAIRFSTGNKIEMLITNPSHQPDGVSLMPKNYLTLHGKVESQINVALGYLQDDSDVEEEDDFVELAYFKTWIAVRNTLQQNTPLLSSEETVDQPVSLDTFLISIYSPHLYIQSTAVEKAILFWVNCKSVYNFWQDQHKQLNTEVQAATEAIVGRFTKPTSQLKTPSIDFSKPRLVQINVTDVGACMPLVPLPTTPHSSQRGFPALVLTIKEMIVSLNLSKRLVSAGKFTGFLIRFDEQFHFRHKTWTTDPKRNKFLNYGIVPSGTYRFCVVNKPKHHNAVEKLFSAFTWHMSGININASTDIGRHISTLVRTLTAIGSDLEEPDTQEQSPSSVPLSHSSVFSRIGHKRTQSLVSKTYIDDEVSLKAMEWDLARQTRKLQKLKLTGAAPDSLKSEEDTFHKIEMDLVRGLRRVFRKGRGITIQQISQILSPRSSLSQPASIRKRIGPSSTLPRKRLISVDECEKEEIQPRSSLHVRHRSDITPDVLRMIQMEEGAVHTPMSTPTHAAKESPLLTSSASLQAVEEEISDEMYEQENSERSNSKHAESLIPSINIELNVTINIDSGSVTLHSEDLVYQEQYGRVISSQKIHDSLLQREKTKSSVDTVLLIPAVEVKVHYQSIVGRSFYGTSQASPQKSGSHTPIGYSPVLPAKFQTDNEGINFAQFDLYDKCGNPIKKGVLTISAVIEPLPQDLELDPNLLDFIEQVVRPINITTQKNDYADSDDDEEERSNTMEHKAPVTKPQSSTRPLSFPVEVCITFTIHPSKIFLNCNPHARVKCLVEIPTVNFIISFSLFTRKQPEYVDSLESSIISKDGDDEIITFNNLNITGCLKTFSLVMFTPQLHTSSPKLTESQSEDKEAFNLVLGQAFVHLSRRSVYGKTQFDVDDHVIHETLKVSVIPVIESLILTYDWRRLNDITWFRKCWYHKGLVEALFMGHQVKDETPPHPASPYYDQHSSSPTSGEESITDAGNAVESNDTITAEIVVAVAVVDLRLYANMAQFMGNAHVLLSHLQGFVHADVQHNELILFNTDGGVEDMEIDAEGGVVAGNIIVKGTSVNIMTSSQDGDIPVHKGSFSVTLIQGHIDYMSAQALLIRATELHINFWDVWKGIVQSPQDQHTAASIQICGSFTWTVFQLAIHRSSVKAMFGIIQRMYDFVMQQKKRSERTIGLMLPAGTPAFTAFAAYQEEQKRAEKSRAAEIENPLLEHHHWSWAVRVGSIQLMNAVGIDVSTNQHDVSLGGSIKVSGSNMCLVCFDGASFRESEWAVINVDLLNAQFSTLAIPGLGEASSSEANLNGKTRICNQICKVQLGDEGSKFKELAAIYRVSAGRVGVPPISPKEIPDWLKYACIDQYIHSNAEDLSLFAKQSQKLTVQPIIGLPAFEATLINDHFWPSLNVLLNQHSMTESATVECSLLSKFHEGISVTTTVENYLFLHDLFKAYLDHIEKHKISFRPPFTGVSQTPQTADAMYSTFGARRFVNIHWELDPRLILMAKAQWASGQVNPHINWLLTTLGFEHARTTIPKGIQRGLMDPLDLGIASLVEKLITISGTKKVKTKDDFIPTGETTV